VTETEHDRPLVPMPLIRGAHGAVVAPLLSSEGCVGALSAEIRGGVFSSGRICPRLTRWA